MFRRLWQVARPGRTTAPPPTATRADQRAQLPHASAHLLAASPAAEPRPDQGPAFAPPVPPRPDQGPAFAPLRLQDVQRIGMLANRERGWFCEETREIVGGFAIGPDDLVIDVGCGHGRTTLFAARHGAQVLATDLNPKKLAVLQKRMAALGNRRCACVLSDTAPLPVPDGIATKIIAMEMLEHVEDPAQILKELVRVGKPGALYLLTAPDPLNESVQRAVAPPDYWTKPHHLRVFQHEQLDALIRSSGLVIERRCGDTFFWALYWILFWASDHPNGEPGPILEHWARTWQALSESPNTAHIRRALDEFMPKSQAVIARKVA